MTSTYALRPVRVDHAEAVALLDTFTGDAEMARQGDVTDLASAQRHLGWLTAAHRRATAITPPDDSDRLVGVVALSIDDANALGWFFYWMHRDHRGAGITSRAAATIAHRALLPATDGGWGLERLELGHRVNNPASGARAAGFVHEGTERQKFSVDGKRIDVLMYGRLRSDPVPATAHLPWE